MALFALKNNNNNNDNNNNNTDNNNTGNKDNLLHCFSVEDAQDSRVNQYTRETHINGRNV